MVDEVRREVIAWRGREEDVADNRGEVGVADAVRLEAARKVRREVVEEETEMNVVGNVRGENVAANPREPMMTIDQVKQEVIGTVKEK